MILYITAILFLIVIVQGGYSPSFYPAGARTAAYQRVMRDTLIITRGTAWSDGNAKADAVLINGTSPGPTLRYRAGDLVIVKVINGLKDANTTIHFHGLSQTLSPSSDGTPMISQWPIAPGNFFEYEMHLTFEDVGTTFYHSHVGLQAMTAAGPLIVEEGKKPYAYASDKVMMLSDYYYERESDILHGLLASPFKWPGSANSALLNGAGWKANDACNTTIAQAAGVDCSTSTYAGPTVVDVDYASVYRLRWIGATTIMHYAAQINNHSQTIITVDGTFVEPINATYIELMSGQRLDSLLQTRTSDQVARDGVQGCYFIRIESRWRKPPTNGWAMLRYPNGKCPTKKHDGGATYIAEQTFGWISDQFHPGKLDTRSPHPSDEEVTRRIVLETQQVPLQKAIQWHVNGEEYNETATVLDNGVKVDEPYLIALYLHKALAPSYERAMNPPKGFQQGYDAQTETYVARAGEVIDVVIINNASALSGVTETHPWHFHSQDHWTMAMGVGNFSEEAYEKAKEQFYPPIARDTTGVWPGLGASISNVTLPTRSSGAWSVLRIRVPRDNGRSGVWMLHCHWAFHQVMGMATVWSFVSADGTPAFSMYQYKDPAYLEFGHNVTA